MGYNIEGTIKHLFDTQTFASGFAKREFVVEVPDGKYPQLLKFECIKDKINQLDEVNLGQAVTVHFDIRGSEYKERFYVQLNAWKVEPGQPSQHSDARGGQQAPAPARTAGHSSSQPVGEDEDDADVPF